MTETALHPDRSLSIGLGVLVLLILAGMFLGLLPYVALLLAAVPVLLTTLFYPKRALVLLLGLQISLEHTQLDLVNFYLGPMRTRLDDVLFWWVMLLWLLSIPDGGGRVRTGSTSRFITLLVGVTLASLVWGLASGNDAGQALTMFKNYPGYLAFFPAAWLLSRDRTAAGHLSDLLIVAGVIAAVNIILRGYFRADEFVYIRSTGLRVQARQANAVGIGLLFLYIRTMVMPRRSNNLLIIPSAILMLAAILLSQTRALWFGILLGGTVATLLHARNRGTGATIKKTVGIIILCVSFFLSTGIILEATGFIGIEDVMQRTGSETGSYYTDASFLARAASWIEVLRQVGSPAGLLLGKGMGFEITCFRFDYMRVVTMPFVDGSYFQILLNAGIPGLLSLLFLYAHGMAKSARLARSEKEPGRESVLLAACASFIMLAFASLLGSPVTNYRFTILFGVLFAMMAVRPGQAAAGGLPDQE